MTYPFDYKSYPYRLGAERSSSVSSSLGHSLYTDYTINDNPNPSNAFLSSSIGHLSASDIPQYSQYGLAGEDHMGEHQQQKHGEQTGLPGRQRPTMTSGVPGNG